MMRSQFDTAAAASDSSSTGNPRPIPRVQRPWIGLAVALLVVAALAWFKPSSLGRLVGPLMLACHGITIVALITLMSEAFALSRAYGTLRKAGADGMADPKAWPRKLLARAFENRFKLADLHHDLIGKNDINQALDRTADDSQEAYSGRWEIYRFLAFVPPLLGLVSGYHDVRIETNLASFADVFQPLAVAWIEAGTWMALTTWLSAKSRAMIEDWRNLAEALAKPSSALVAEVLGGTHQVVEAREVTESEPEKVWSGSPFTYGASQEDADPDRTEGPLITNHSTDEPAKSGSLGAIFDTLFTSTTSSPSAEGHDDD